MMGQNYWKIVSPIDGEVMAERKIPSFSEINRRIENAQLALKEWRKTPLTIRIHIVLKAIEILEGNKVALGRELTLQMGRPITQSHKEIERLVERVDYMIKVAAPALAPIWVEKNDKFRRWIEKQPLGIIFVLAPWNYPYLTAGNAVFPALIAGNVILLKHSDQTLLVAERIVDALEEAGIPRGVCQFLHATHEQVAKIVKDPRINQVIFTGSLVGGLAVQRAMADQPIGLNLELAAKDPAYVRADADLENVVPAIADGAFFNAGQSCCAIKRVYVHNSIFKNFCDFLASETHKLVLDDPLSTETTLGPMVRAENSAKVRRQVEEALGMGASLLVKESDFARSISGTPYLGPQILIGTDRRASIVADETFGPAITVDSVTSDEEAIHLMNDSAYGLTASIWTSDLEQATVLASKLETGTVLMNRADHVDPGLAWVGVKHSGKGWSLSELGYLQLIRPKSFHFKLR